MYNNMSKAEERLRTRIRRVLSVAGVDEGQTSSSMDQVEQDVIDLFRDYSQAPEHLRDQVYAKGEEKLLRSLERSDSAGSASSSA